MEKIQSTSVTWNGTEAEVREYNVTGDHEVTIDIDGDTHRFLTQDRDRKIARWKKRGDQTELAVRLMNRYGWVVDGDWIAPPMESVDRRFVFTADQLGSLKSADGFVENENLQSVLDSCQEFYQERYDELMDEIHIPHEDDFDRVNIGSGRIQCLNIEETEDRYLVHLYHPFQQENVPKQETGEMWYHRHHFRKTSDGTKYEGSPNPGIGKPNRWLINELENTSTFPNQEVKEGYLFYLLMKVSLAGDSRASLLGDNELENYARKTLGVTTAIIVENNELLRLGENDKDPVPDETVREVLWWFPEMREDLELTPKENQNEIAREYSRLRWFNEAQHDIFQKKIIDGSLIYDSCKNIFGEFFALMVTKHEDHEILCGGSRDKETMEQAIEKLNNISQRNVEMP